ncbi:unnamed protein product [Tetraodon nigroviridis]|uniref:(spotted green pufferfish) hypothetical protein n=1 Tax=Tetraodon nigroviridis TaxID=99883 RepID=Q4SP99_TETNG|nr:unnamed protein product [Tetraodon nigroviridis]
MRKRRNSPLGSRHHRQDGPSSHCAAEVGPRVQPAAAAPPECPLKIRHLIMPQQGQNLLGFLNRDQTRQQFCDVMVSVGGNLHRAHKVVLAHGSSYFHAELSKNPAAEHVTLDHVEDSVFRHLLELLYTSECFIMEKDVPALIRAARFLDMMDVLKLLSGDGDPAGEGGVRAAEAEPAGDADIHSSGSLCSAESLRGDASESPRRRSAEGQADVCQEVPAETETATASTRRSTRRRRTPTKFGRNSPARPGLGDEETPETGAAEEDEGGTNEEEARTTAEEQEGRTRSDHPSVPEVETESSTRGPVYPEGLAPVIIHTSNKKTLKCPKCDKTFDRAGGGTVRLRAGLLGFGWSFLHPFSTHSYKSAQSGREVPEPHQGAHGGEAVPV